MVKIDIKTLTTICSNYDGNIDAIINELTERRHSARQERFNQLCQELKEKVKTIQKEFPDSGAIYQFLNQDYDTEEIDLFSALLDKSVSFEM